MRQMILRFFLYIWGAILGTTLLVIGLAITIGGPPPGHVSVAAVVGPIREAAQQAFAQEGRAGVDRLLALDARLSEQFLLVVAKGAACAGPDLIGATGDSCLLLQLRPAQPPWLRLFLPFFFPMVIGAGISVLIAFALAHRFARPVQRISEGLEALSRGQLDLRIGPALTDSEPAIADVGRAFDVAADKLQELTEGRSRLFHDISHEIRSPLARLQAQAALLRQNPARLPAMLPRMEGDISRMDQLVGEILTLARLERGGEIALNMMKIDLIDILDPILRDAGLEGQTRQISLRYTGPEQLVLTCDPEMLHRAFENILRNALRFAPAASTVDVSVGMSEQMIEVAISDRGPGVDEAQLWSILQPFVREAEGRGTGLGLAIASNAIRQHGGMIEAANREGGGLVVRCRISVRS